MKEKAVNRRQHLLDGIGIIIAGIIIALACTGCITVPIPEEVGTAMIELHKGDIIIADFIIENYKEEDDVGILTILQRHLELSKEMNNYIQKAIKEDK